MATYRSSTDSKGYTLRLDVNETSYSVENNNSQVSWALYIETSKGYYFQTSGNAVNVSIDGNVYSNSDTYIEMPSATTTLIASGSKPVKHNNDGKKTISVSASFSPSWSASYMPSNLSLSGSLKLTDIPRQANLTEASNFNDEENPTIKYSNPAGNSVSSLQACISLTSSADDIKYRDISKTGTSYTFNLTDEERSILRNATVSFKRTVYMYVRTVIGSNTFYSSKSVEFSIVNANPIFNEFSFEDISPKTIVITGDNQSIIKGQSSIKATIESTNKAVAQKGATMSKYRFFCGDNSVDIDYQTTDVTGILDNVNSGKFEVIAIDSRGNPKSVIKQAINIYEYSPLEKINIEVSRSNGISEDVTLKLEGKVDLFTYGTGNEITFSKYRYKSTRESAWSEYQPITLTIQDNKFSFNNLISGDKGVNGFNIENSYQIEVLIKDKLTEVLYTYTLGSGIPNIALHKNGVSIMGKYDTSIGGDLQVRGKKFDIDSNVRKMRDYIELEDGTDLNTIINNGTYRSVATAHTATMQNVPSQVTGGFTMYVVSYTSTTNNNSYRRQELINSVNTYVRTTSNGGSTWSNWREISLELNYKDNGIVATNEFLNGKRIYTKRFSTTDSIGSGNNYVLEIPHGITNFDELWIDVSYSHFYANKNSARYMSIPIVATAYVSNSNDEISASIYGNNILIIANGGWGNLWTKVVTIKFTYN